MPGLTTQDEWLAIAATLSPECKEGGAEAIAGDVDGLYGDYGQQEGFWIFAFWERFD
jgi:hypothetical protein